MDKPHLFQPGHDQKYFFSKEDDEIIKRVYEGFRAEGTSRGVTLAARRALGRDVSRAAISRRAVTLGVAFSKRPAAWTDEQIQKLEQLSRRGLSEKQIAKAMGRSEYAIHSRKYRSGIYRAGDGSYTMNDLCIILGETERTIKSWITQGLLPARKPTGSNFYCIPRKNVLMFLRNYKGMIRLYKVEPIGFLDLVLGE